MTGKPKEPRRFKGVCVIWGAKEESALTDYRGAMRYAKAQKAKKYVSTAAIMEKIGESTYRMKEVIK